MSELPFTNLPLPPDSPLYVRRAADRDIIKYALDMAYVTLIEPRGQGKTSLLLQLGVELPRYGMDFLLISLELMMKPGDSEDRNHQLRLHVLEQARRAGLDWEGAERLPLDWTQFWDGMARELERQHRRLVIAFDGMKGDLTTWATDFFVSLRAAYLYRGSMAHFQHLTFILSGSFHPEDLISYKELSPFNVAQRVRLLDFNFDQTRQITQQVKCNNPEQLADQVYRWTRGQPLLTQALCLAFSQSSGSGTVAQQVDQSVERLFEELDGYYFPSLSATLDPDRQRGGEVDFLTYLSQVRGQRIEYSESQNRIQFYLTNVAGVLSRAPDGSCEIRNPIIQRYLESLIGAQQASYVDNHWARLAGEVSLALMNRQKAGMEDFVPRDQQYWDQVKARYLREGELPSVEEENTLLPPYGRAQLTHLGEYWRMALSVRSERGEFSIREPFDAVMNLMAEETGLCWEWGEPTFRPGDLPSFQVHELRLPRYTEFSNYKFLFVFLPPEPTENLPKDLALLADQLDTAHKCFVLIHVREDGKERLNSLDELVRTLRFGEKIGQAAILNQKDLYRVLCSPKPALELAQAIIRQVSPKTLSPFRAGGPMMGGMFFGRVQEIAAVNSGLEMGSFSIIGNRRIGKSSLLQKLYETLGSLGGYAPVKYDLQTAVNYKSFYEKINATSLTGGVITAANNRLQPDGWGFIKKWIGSRTSPAAEFREVAAQLKKEAGGKCPVLLFDEIDALLVHDEQHGYPLSLVWRELSDAGECRFIFAGHRVLARMKRDSRSPWFNFTSPIHLGFLEKSFAVQLIPSPLREIEVDFVDGPVFDELLWQVSAGHPYVIQAMGKRLLEMLDPEERRISPAMLQRVLTDTEFMLRNYVDTMWGGAELNPLQGLSPIERSIFLFSGSEPFEVEEISRRLMKEGYQIRDIELRYALETLVTFGLFQQSYSTYLNRVPYFQEYLEKIKLLDSCKSELLLYWQKNNRG